MSIILSKSLSTLDYLVLLILFLLLLGCLLYPNRSLGTGDRPDLSGPKGVPLLGNLLHLYPHRKNMLSHLGDMEKLYGELFTFTMPGWGRNIIVNRPEWLEHIRKGDNSIYGKGEAALKMFREFPGSASPFSTEGQEWKLSRRAIQPVFAAKNFDTDVRWAMDEVLPTALKLLRHAAEQDIEFDFNHFCGRVVLKIFCQMALGLDTDLLTTDPTCLKDKHRLVDATMVLNRISSGRLFNPIWPLTEKFDGDETAFRSARQEIFDVVERIIRERRTKPPLEPHHEDFLSTLLATQRSGDKFLRDTLVTLLFASRDTLQNAIGWSLYELSKKPEWTEKMREELNDMHGDKIMVTYSELSRFPIHLAAFYETLRLWPGVPKNARVAVANDILPAIPGVSGPVKISKGDYVVWSDYAMMRNPKVWGPTANEFDPGRHLNELGKFTKPSIPMFHAFGAGPRYCPGAQLAVFEFVAFWAAVLPYFDIVPVEMKARFPTDALTMSMDGPFIVKAKIRQVT